MDRAEAQAAVVHNQQRIAQTENESLPGCAASKGQITLLAAQPFLSSSACVWPE